MATACTRVGITSLPVLIFLGVALPAAAQDFGWSPGMNTTGVKPYSTAAVRALQPFDDGTGEALYVGGDFIEINGMGVNYLAKWDGVRYSPLPVQLNDNVITATLSSNKDSEVLVVGGVFTSAGGTPLNRIAAWNGSSWSSFGTGMDGAVWDVLVHNGTLYAAGNFLTAGGNTVNRVAAWNGSEWLPLASGTDAQINVMAIFDDGTGPALYVAGIFSNASGTPANGIARWDGNSWSALSTGVNGSVHALQVFDDGSGAALYVGGTFSTAGGQPVNRIARWNGKTWSAVGGGFAGGTQPAVGALTVHNDGAGPALYAAGRFEAAAGNAAASIAKWNGQTWQSFPGGSGINPIGDPFVRTLLSYDDGTGSALYVGGKFTTAGGVRTNGLAKWSGAAWSTVGVCSWIGNLVRVLHAFDNGTESALYAGGDFTEAGSVHQSHIANRVAQWRGTAWTPLGEGLPAVVNALIDFNDGDGSTLYAGTSGSLSSSAVRKWNGTAWDNVGLLGGQVRTLGVYDDGSGAAIYAGGTSLADSGNPINLIARWNGTQWSEVGGGISAVGFAPVVQVMTVFDTDGPGPLPAHLYVAGRFNRAGGIVAEYIARWDGKQWSALDGGLTGPGNKWVYALMPFVDEDGPALFVAGTFPEVNGMNAHAIAKWTSKGWSPLRGGVTDHTVSALAVFDDGAGPFLYAGGAFTVIDDVAANRVAKWDGTTWLPLSNGLSGSITPTQVYALEPFDAGSGPALYAGGNFHKANGRESLYFAAWSLDDSMPVIDA